MVSDVDMVRDILWRTWDATYSAFIPSGDLHGYFNARYAPDQVRDLLIDPHVVIHLGERQARPIATMITRYTPEEDRMYVSSLYVLPEAQGQGVGSILLRAAEECALARGLFEIWLGVMTQNTRAVAWYERIGFQFTRREPFAMGGTTVEHLIGFRRVRGQTSGVHGVSPA
jgi:ribosomal protein S18 acetylase RimI-like enzyme